MYVFFGKGCNWHFEEKKSATNVDGFKYFKYPGATLPFRFSAMIKESGKTKFVGQEKSEKDDERNLKRMMREIWKGWREKSD